jgi:hypothetical protein
MKKYSYVKKLKEMEHEFMEMGVSIYTKIGRVVSWWKVPSKYRYLVMGSLRDEFTDFMAATGLCDAEITMDNGNLLFNAKIDFSELECFMANGKEEWMTSAIFMDKIADLRYMAINNACHKAVRTKALYQDFIRACFYRDRMNRELEPMPEGY